MAPQQQHPSGGVGLQRGRSVGVRKPDGGAVGAALTTTFVKGRLSEADLIRRVYGLIQPVIDTTTVDVVRNGDRVTRFAAPPRTRLETGRLAHRVFGVLRAYRCIFVPWISPLWTPVLELCRTIGIGDGQGCARIAGGTSRWPGHDSLGVRSRTMRSTRGEAGTADRVETD